jgi:large subunit ribosomal protein L7Ae
VGKKKAQLVVTAHEVEPIGLMVFFPALCQKMGSLTASSRERPGWGTWFIGRHAPQLPSQVNLEDKGALAKLVEAIRTNYNDRYNEICYHWRGNILRPKPVAHIAKMEKQKAKELVTKLG